MEKWDCSICNHPFDSDSHRPRALPCGHGFCTRCIQSCIDRGNPACSVCRKEHGANSATDLPVSFFLEEYLQKASISAAKMLVPFPAEKVVMCPKHMGVPLHFHCKSHQEDICHSCAVLDHPPTVCKIISYEDKMKEMKEVIIASVRKHKQGLVDTENDLKIICQDQDDHTKDKQKNKKDLEKEVELLIAKIELTNKEIEECKNTKKRITDSIEICQKKQTEMDVLESTLRVATGNQAIAQECRKITSEIDKIKKWEDTLRNDFELNQKYGQVQRNGIICSSKIIYSNGRMLIPSLSAQIKPERSAKLIKEADMGLYSGNTKVFLDLSAQGFLLGRVIINVMGDRTHGQQFIMLALGSEGSTLKGACFARKCEDFMMLREYITETGSRSGSVLLSTLTREHGEKATRGKLFPDSCGAFPFIIMVNNWNIKLYGYFGDVIDGMDVVDRAFSSEFKIENIMISNCGIILNN